MDGGKSLADLAELEALAERVVESGLPIGPAELHGAVCGIAVFDLEQFPFNELIEVLDPGLAGDELALEAFVAAACSTLADDDFGFQPLLPGDTAPLAERLEALGRWCDGFLRAFAGGLALAPDFLGDGESDFGLPAELQELLDDFAAIAEVETELDEADEPDEADTEAQLVELEEFVKVGVLVIRSGLSSDGPDPID